MGGGGAVGGGGDDLTQGLGADVSCGVDAREVRLGGFSGQDIALGVQFYLPLEKGCLGMRPMAAKSPLAWQLLPPAGGPVLQGQGFQLFSAGQTGQERPRWRMTLGQAARASCSRAPRSCVPFRKITWTWRHSRARLRAEAAAPLPPPSTATSLFRKNMPSQVAQ